MPINARVMFECIYSHVVEISAQMDAQKERIDLAIANGAPPEMFDGLPYFIHVRTDPEFYAKLGARADAWRDLLKPLPPKK